MLAMFCFPLFEYGDTSKTDLRTLTRKAFDLNRFVGCFTPCLRKVFRAKVPSAVVAKERKAAIYFLPTSTLMAFATDSIATPHTTKFIISVSHVERMIGLLGL